MEDERVVAGLHCGEVLADLSEHLDGRLSLDRAERIDEHLAGCAGCRRFVGEVTAAVRGAPAARRTSRCLPTSRRAWRRSLLG